MLALSVFSFDNMVPAFLLEFAHVAGAWSGAMVSFLGLPAVASLCFNRGAFIRPIDVQI